jgi:hypothetical protein
VKAKQVGMVLLWVLAVVLPGGFPMMAVWMSIRAVRGNKPLLTASAQAVPAV